jgi:hypothetical protein
VPVNNMAWNWAWASSSSASRQVNFAPTMAVAQVSLSGADGEGLCRAGITQYRTRTTPSGADHDHNFGWSTNFGYPPIAYDPIMTSVTADLVMGSGQSGVMSVMVSLW